jgi:hypothetical protein
VGQRSGVAAGVVQAFAFAALGLFRRRRSRIERQAGGRKREQRQKEEEKGECWRRWEKAADRPGA